MRRRIRGTTSTCTRRTTCRRSWWRPRSSETASDDWFGDVNDDGVPEVAIGRLPVQAASEAAALVAKMVAYDAAGAATWKNQALLVAGTNDSENNFEAYTGRSWRCCRRA